MRRKSVLGGGNSINKRGRGDQVCSGKRRGPGCLEPSECGGSRDGAGGRAGPALRAQAALPYLRAFASSVPSAFLSLFHLLRPKWSSSDLSTGTNLIFLRQALRRQVLWLGSVWNHGQRHGSG